MTESAKSSPILRVRNLKKRYVPKGTSKVPFWFQVVVGAAVFVAIPVVTLLGVPGGWLGGAAVGFFVGGLIEVVARLFSDRLWPRDDTAGTLEILRGVDLDIYEGETLAIVGPSGAGKSTLLHLMGALDPPSDGAIIYRGNDLTSLGGHELDDYRNKRVGFVFQFYYLYPELTALDNVLLPAMIQSSILTWFTGANARYRTRAVELLKQVGLESRSSHKPSQLSGGEQQRVAIARALLLEPELLLCDEPTGNLDRRTGEEILDLLWKFKAEGKHTYVIVTHDMRLAARADRTVEIEDGKVKAMPSAKASSATDRLPEVEPLDPALLDTGPLPSDSDRLPESPPPGGPELMPPS